MRRIFAWIDFATLLPGAPLRQGPRMSRLKLTTINSPTIPFWSIAAAKAWGLSADGPYSFAAIDHGQVRRFTYSCDGRFWAVMEVY